MTIYKSKGEIRMKRNKGMILIMLLLGILITGCSSKSASDSTTGRGEMAVPQESPQAQEEMGMSEDAKMDGGVVIGEGTPQRNKNQKLIYRASRHVEVTGKLEPLVLSVKEFVEAHNGYIENMEQYRYGYDPVTQGQLDAIIMRIRIPHEHYNQTLVTIDELGAVINKSSSVEDVTLQYSDIESTLKMYKVEQERLLKMMENETTDVKDMIEIEKRLSEVRIEIEKQESARRALESQINYDTIDLEMNQVRTVSNINQTENFGTRIKVTFMKSIDNAKVFIQELTLGVTYMLIPFSILVIILWTGYIVILKVIKARKDKKKSAVLPDKDDGKA